MERCFYFDGQTAQAHECLAHFSETTIHLYLSDQHNTLIIWDRSGIKHFDLTGNILSIRYGDFPHQVLEFKGSSSTPIFNELARHRFEKKAQGYWLNHKLTIAISSCVAFVVMCLLSYFMLLPWMSEKSVALIPREIEVSLGDKIAESLLQTYNKKDSATHDANLFISHLHTNSPYAIRLTVVASEEINAFALPGGQIFIYSEIIKRMDSYEQFAALLGHEISHVNYQHSLKSICRTATSSMVIAYLFGDVTGISSGILQQANEFKQLHYSRELETQADNEGYALMLQNNISPKGMVDLLHLLQKESQETPDLMTYFSTHPETQKRIDNINSKPGVLKKFADNEALKQLFNQLKSHLD